MSILKIFDRVPCVVGAVSLGTLSGLQGSFKAASGAPSSGSFTCTAQQLRDAQLEEGVCVEVDHPRRGRSWWFVEGIEETTGSDRVSVTLSPLRSQLARCGFIRQARAGDSDLYRFTPEPQTVRAGLAQFVLPGRVPDGFSWLLGVGDVRFTGVIDVGVIDQWTYEQYLSAVERATRQQLVLRPDLTTTGQLRGFWLDLRAVRSSRPPLPLYQGPIVRVTSRRASLDEACSVVLPVADNGQTMGLTVWQITSATTGSPSWLTLADPSGGDGPLVEDGQFVGNAIMLADGTALPILASRVVDQAVQVARPLPVGNLVRLVRDTAGAILTELASPSALARPRGRVVRKATVAKSRTEWNGIGNGDFRDGATGWTRIGANGRLTARARSEPPLLEGTVRVAAAAGAAVLELEGLPPGAPLFRGDAVRAPAWVATTGPGVGNSAGIVTVSVTPVVPAGGIADGTRLPIRFPDGTVRNTVASGAQAAGAGTVTLGGLPVTPSLAIGQTIGVQEGFTAFATVINAPNPGAGVTSLGVAPLSIDLAPGTLVSVTEAWRTYQVVNDGFGTSFVPQTVQITTDGTVVGGYTAGAFVISIDFGGNRFPPAQISLPGAPPPLFLTGSFAYGTSTTRTYTVQSAPAWDANGEADVLITPAIVQAIGVGVTPSWSANADLVLPLGAAVSATTIRLRVITANALPAGGTIRLEGETLFGSAQLTTSATGEATVALHAPTVGALAVGRVIRVVRVRDLAEDQPGSPTTLQLDTLGVGAALQVIARSTPAQFRVTPPASVTLRAKAGVTAWGVRQASNLVRWRITIGSPTAGFTPISALTLVALPDAGDEFGSIHSTLNVTETLTATGFRHMQISAEKDLGTMEFDMRLRWAMLTLSADADVPFTPGGHSNLPHQAGSAVLRARSNPERLRLTGVAMQRLIDAFGPPDIGQQVRVFTPELGVDRWTDIVEIGYSFDLAPEDITVGSLDPTLAFVSVA